ncbi:MAG: electron transport complex subunit RsxC [Desulfarculales bacterium]|jgi:electron transport complex protein RnfC|nr:electron transport complex subunit RsxC [Desulfarculales bacterium]
MAKLATIFSTFALGGIHPPDSKELSKDLPVEVMPLPDVVTIPLNMQILTATPPVEAVVDKKAVLSEGQLIGKPIHFLGVNIHSSVSGTVKAVDTISHHMMLRVPGVIVDVDKNAPPPHWPARAWQELNSRELLDIIKETGVVGMGGAGFPAHIKLNPPPNSPVDILLINAAECEPYLNCDYRLMLERAADLLDGVKIIMKTLGVEKAYIGIEDNKPLAVKSLEEAMAERHQGIGLAVLKVKYPQGSEKQLIQAVTGRVVPDGALPAAVGVVVQNVGTTVAIYEAVALSKPVYEKVLTVSGRGIARPANLKVRLGTTVQQIIDYLGGTTGDLAKVILGGPMMGLNVSDLNIPVTKTFSGILFLTKEEAALDSFGPCIRCGRCISVCPMGLNPMETSAHAEAGHYADTLAYGVRSCFECGCCAYMCPAKRPLVQFMKLSKLKNPIR